MEVGGRRVWAKEPRGKWRGHVRWGAGSSGCRSPVMVAGTEARWRGGGGGLMLPLHLRQVSWGIGMGGVTQTCRVFNYVESSSPGFAWVPGHGPLGINRIIQSAVTVFHAMECAEQRATFSKISFPPLVVLPIMGLSLGLYFSSLNGTQMFADS